MNNKAEICLQSPFSFPSGLFSDHQASQWMNISLAFIATKIEMHFKPNLMV